MARVQRRDSTGRSYLSPDISQAHRVTTSTSNEDLFFSLAKDEPSDASGRLVRTRHDPTTKNNIAAQSSSPSGPLYPRRTASTQVNTSTLSSPPTSDTNYKPSRFLSRPSYSSTASEQLRDVSSDRASLSSTDQMLSKYDDPTITASGMTASATSKSRPWGNKLSEGQPSPASSTVNGYKRSQRSTLKPSNLSYEANRSTEPAYAPQLTNTSDRSPTWGLTAQENTESVGSTTAASTVWDELEELRQRIRRLEFNGTRAKSGGGAAGIVAGADDSPDRPHTATTMTTNSSASHAGKRALSSPTHHLQFDSTQTYPLLRSAMQKAKTNVYPEVYKSLEASVCDALGIVTMLPKPGSPIQIDGFGETSATEATSLRKLRKKSEGLCRSLTELCIALCEDSNRQTLKNGQTAGASDSPIHLHHRSNDNSPLSYLDERRARLDRARNVPYHSSSRASSTVGPPTINDDAASSHSRYSIASKYSRQRQSNADPEETLYASGRALSRASAYRSQEDGEDRDPTVRAPSRALSEIQHTRHSAARDAHKFSRDYTLRHPLPDRPLPSLLPSHTNTIQSNPNLPPLQTGGASSSRPHLRIDSDKPNEVDEFRSVSRQSGASARSTTLAERLEARRQLQNQQQVASAVQLGSITSATAASRSRGASASKRPASAGRLSRYDRSGSTDDLMSS